MSILQTWMSGQPDADADATPDEASAPGGGASSEWNIVGLDAEAGAAAPSRARRIGEGVGVIGVVFLIGVGALWAMRAAGAVDVSASASTVEIQVEKALAQLRGGAAVPDDAQGTRDLSQWLHASDRLIARFTDDGTDKQIALHMLGRNPFAMVGRPEPQPAAEAGPTNPRADARAERMRQLRREFETLQLEMVMTSRTPMAVINGRLVRQGEPYGSFTVTRIEPRTAVLTAAGNTYRLSMRMPQMNPNPAHD